MRKKIIIISIIVVLIASLSVLFIMNNNKGNSKSSTKNNTDNTKEITTNNDDYNYDFSNYEIIDVNLDEVNDNYEITKTAVYHFIGKLKGSIKVNSEDNIKIVLDNVTITSVSGPCINVENAKNLYIELVGESTLSDSTNYTDETLDAVIYSKDDLILFGDGTLNINANYKDGIASKDDLVIKSGTYKINSKDDAIRGKDSVIIYDGNFDITSNGDAIKTTNDTDSDKGNILISGGTLNITTTNGDGIDSVNSIEIAGGNFNITTGKNSDNKDASTKGIKAENSIIIKDIIIEANTLDDAIHSNSDITITSGTFTITSKDDGIHADGKIEINDGTYTINSEEGIEATYVKIDGGKFIINASDDGINAANKSTNYDVTIEINGGDITIKMGAGDTDAIDSNGNLYINGGTINITANSPFDYDGESKYTGGKMIVNGEETTTITNQMMGGGGMPQGNMQGPGGDMRRR